MKYTVQPKDYQYSNKIDPLFGKRSHKWLYNITKEDGTSFGKLKGSYKTWEKIRKSEGAEIIVLPVITRLNVFVDLGDYHRRCY